MSQDDTMSLRGGWAMGFSLLGPVQLETNKNRELKRTCSSQLNRTQTEVQV